jgi:peptide/nickel transport system ATP-binding protein
LIRAADDLSQPGALMTAPTRPSSASSDQPTLGDAGAPAGKPLLRVSGLSLDAVDTVGARDRVSTRQEDGAASRVRDLSFEIHAGADRLDRAAEFLGLVGESGSGKTLTALAIAGLLPPGIRMVAGSITFMPPPERRNAAVVFQDSRAALSPVRRVGAQLSDVLASTGTPRAARRGQALDLLTQVGIDDPARCLRQYAFELSGGMCQRVLIALALASKPALLIADEPTTGLDTVNQAIVLDLLTRVAKETAMGMLLITHDLAVALGRCSRIAIMRHGRIVETLPAHRFLSDAAHPYTRQLIAATPQLADVVANLGTQSHDAHAAHETGKLAPEPTPLLVVQGLSKTYRTRDDATHERDTVALENVSFALEEGDALGIVGASGSGKSTLAEIVARLQDPDSGTLHFEGVDVGQVNARQAARAPWRDRIQLVFQDARGSLDPLATVHDAIATALLANGRPQSSQGRDTLQRNVEALAEQVGLSHALLTRMPHQLSGGEAARVGIARALASRPALLILDEPTASLDVATQAGIITLIDSLRRREGLAILLIAHDLDVVRLLCRRVLVMQAGRVIESGSVEQILSTPAHAYTRALIAAKPALRITTA